MNDRYIDHDTDESTGLDSQYRDMASDVIREHEAEEWIEGLIADASI